MRDGRVARVLFCSLSSLMALCFIAQRALQQQSRGESDICNAFAGTAAFVDLHTPFYSVYGLCQPNSTVPHSTVSTVSANPTELYHILLIFVGFLYCHRLCYHCYQNRMLVKLRSHLVMFYMCECKQHV